MPGIASIKTLNIPSVAEGPKVTLSLTFMNVGDEADQFWVSVDEYEGDVTMNVSAGTGGATNIFNKKIEDLYYPDQLATFYKDLVVPQKDKWQLRISVGHYSDPAKTVQQVDDYKDVTVLKNKLVPQEKTWVDMIS